MIVEKGTPAPASLVPHPERSGFSGWNLTQTMIRGYILLDASTSVNLATAALCITEKALIGPSTT